MFLLYNGVILPIHSYTFEKFLPKNYLIKSVSISNLFQCKIITVNGITKVEGIDYTLHEGRLVYHTLLPNHPVIEIIDCYDAGNRTARDRLLNALSLCVCMN
jgi:hypothetical protein